MRPVPKERDGVDRGLNQVRVRGAEGVGRTPDHDGGTVVEGMRDRSGRFDPVETEVERVEER
jgi:hypothetical protein